MLPLKVIFQNLDGKYSYFILHGILAIYMQNRQFHSHWFIAAFSQIYTEHQWKVTTDSRTRNTGAHLDLSG